MRIMKAQSGKIFAIKNAEGNEILLSDELYLGANDDGSDYYEVDAPKSENEAETVGIKEEPEE